MIKILIADNSMLIREGLKVLISSQDNLQVVAEVDRSEGLSNTKLIRSVDVLIIDFTEPDFKPEDIEKSIVINPELKVLAISNQISKLSILRAIEAGISGYVLKECDRDEILEAIVRAKEGKNFFCGKILDAVLVKHNNEANLGEIVSCCEPVDISTREMEIIKLIAEGLTNKEIADKLFLSTHTINTHRKNIMQKLGIGNTAGLVMYALKEKIVSANAAK